MPGMPFFLLLLGALGQWSMLIAKSGELQSQGLKAQHGGNYFLWNYGAWPFPIFGAIKEAFVCKNSSTKFFESGASPCRASVSPVSPASQSPGNRPFHSKAEKNGGIRIVIRQIKHVLKQDSDRYDTPDQWG